MTSSSESLDIAIGSCTPSAVKFLWLRCPNNVICSAGTALVTFAISFISSLVRINAFIFTLPGIAINPPSVVPTKKAAPIFKPDSAYVALGSNTCRPTSRGAWIVATPRPTRSADLPMPRAGPPNGRAIKFTGSTNPVVSCDQILESARTCLLLCIESICAIISFKWSWFFASFKSP